MGSYFIFSVLYSWYLNISVNSNYYPDYFTQIVALQSEAVIEAFGYSSKIMIHPNEASLKLFVNDIFLARIVEGCNSISIIILFTSFILSFFAKFKITFFYILSGAVIIYCANILRVVILAIGIYEYPQHTSFMHSIVFPLIIYGTVFLLWIFWVWLFSKNTIDEKAI